LADADERLARLRKKAGDFGMKILFCSYAFWPNVGGIETVSARLAETWNRAGESIVMLSQTAAEKEQDWPFPIKRKMKFWAEVQEAGNHDLVYSNGASLRYALVAVLAGKPFVWTHTAYQVTCIDALGIVDRKPAPVTPWASVGFHLRHRGLWRGLYGGLLLAIRRLVAWFYAYNVEITYFMAEHHPLPRQQVIYNPFFLRDFKMSDKEKAVDQAEKSEATFSYLGRLVMEKGVHLLIRAFARLVENDRKKNVESAATLKIIGTGAEEPYLRGLAEELGVSGQIRWVGCKTGTDLVEEIRHSGIFVLPSMNAEPQGIVVLEMMAAGKPLIVTGPSGLSECARDAALTVPCNDLDVLAAAMERLRKDVDLQKELIGRGLDRVRDFNPEKSAQDYLVLFKKVLECA
jgi:glycosyltransferase involved in cell wall biosynthesis